MFFTDESHKFSHHTVDWPASCVWGLFFTVAVMTVKADVKSSCAPAREASRPRSRLTQQSTFTASSKWPVGRPNGEAVSLLAQCCTHIHTHRSTEPNKQWLHVALEHWQANVFRLLTWNFCPGSFFYCSCCSAAFALLLVRKWPGSRPPDPPHNNPEGPHAALSLSSIPCPVP